MRIRSASQTLLLFLVVALSLSAPASVKATDEAPAQLALMETPTDTPLADILSGKAQPGFTPVLSPGLSFSLDDDKAIWLRVRADLPAVDSSWVLWLDRQPIDQLQLYQSNAPDQVVASAGFGEKGVTRWPSGYLLAVPAAHSGPAELYVRMQGHGAVTVHPALLTVEAAADRESGRGQMFWLMYGVAIVTAVLAVVRHRQRSNIGALGVAMASVFTLIGLLAINGHLISVPGLRLLAKFGVVGAYGLMLLPAGPLLLVNRGFSGLDKSAPMLVPWFIRASAIFVVVAVAALFLPLRYLSLLQTLLAMSWGAVTLGSLMALAMDSRTYRWVPLLLWFGLLGASVARSLVAYQDVSQGWFGSYGYQLLLVLLVSSYLFLPWIRSLQQDRAAFKRAQPPEMSSHEMVDVAREQMITSLQTGLRHASDSDLEWITYRRLLQGLKPVLSQSASAVVAMNFHGEDMLIAEPKSSEERFRLLLTQRSTLLKNLCRSKAPQQIGIDFDGPDGPLREVQLAVIPLPIDKPGWGALLVERSEGVSYSEEELELGTEFASLATTAGEEAAEAMEAKQQALIDSTTGVYRHSVMEQKLREECERAVTKSLSLNLILLGPHDREAWRAQVGAEGAQSALRTLATFLRNEAEYGETVGRHRDDDFMILMPGRTPTQVRELCARLLASAPGMAINAGISELRPEERLSTGLLQRAGEMLEHARKAGPQQFKG